MAELAQELPFYCPECGEGMTINCGSGIKVMVGNEPYPRPLISQSLAINPNQIAEHREKFPDVDVLSDGCLKFNDFRSHDNYLKATGFQKIPQRIR